MRQNSKSKRMQPKKDSKSPRVNFDNTRESKFKKDEERMESGKWGTTKGRNAISWYDKNPQALTSAASISTMFPTGSLYPWTKGKNIEDAAVPAVMSIQLKPMLLPDDPALNQAAQSLYSFVVHANSRNKSYDPSDLMLMTLGGAFIFSALAKGIRAYGCMTAFNSENSQLPEQLIKAQGFDYTDLVANYSHMCSDINLRIARSRDIWIPKDIPLLERWFWLNTNVYVDSESIKDQMYVLKLDQMYKVDEIGSTTGGRLARVTTPDLGAWGSGRVKWNEYLSMLDEMFDAFMQSQDRGTMTGDMLKAYGISGMYQLSEIDPGYKVLVTYDPEVLTQIMNATVAPLCIMSSIEQNPNTSTLTPKYDCIQGTTGNIITPTATYKAEDMIPDYAPLNFKFSTAPTPQQVVEATRLTALGRLKVATAADSTKYINIPHTCGTEVVNRITVFRKGYDNKGAVYYSTYNNIGNTPRNDSTLVPFDWRPNGLKMEYENVSTEDSSTVSAMTPVYIKDVYCELENMSPLHWSTLQRINQVCIYSLFGVPHF